LGRVFSGILNKNDGLKDGLYKHYCENGHLMYEGVWKEYWQNGQLDMERVYKNGELAE
jgi:antitoxin component YwqK of YwqJK toxin-antitoxin module